MPLSNICDPTVWERIQIGRAAWKRGLLELAEDQIRFAANHLPLSLDEVVGIYEVARDFKLEATIAAIEAAVINIPQIVLENSEDTTSVLDTITIMGSINPEAALSRLTSLFLSGAVSIWSVPEVVDRVSTLVVEAEALRIASPVIQDALEELVVGEEELRPSIWALEPLFERGWVGDLDLIIRYALDESNRFHERVGAAALALQSARNSREAELARQALNQLVQMPDRDISQTALAVSRLARQGFLSDAIVLVDSCLASSILGTEDRLRIASALDDLGRQAQANELLQGCDVAELSSLGLMPADKRRLEEALGQKASDDLARARFDNESGVIFDRLMEAREQVESRGDTQALALIRSVATNETDEAFARLEAIDTLHQLGFRGEAISTFDGLATPAVEPYWIADFVLRLGRKEEALKLYRQTLVDIPDINHNLIADGLAQLGAVKELEEFKIRTAEDVIVAR